MSDTGKAMEWRYRPGDTVSVSGRSTLWDVPMAETPHWSWLGGTPAPDVMARALRPARART